MLGWEYLGNTRQACTTCSCEAVLEEIERRAQGQGGVLGAVGSQQDLHWEVAHSPLLVPCK